MHAEEDGVGGGGGVFHMGRVDAVAGCAACAACSLGPTTLARLGCAAAQLAAHCRAAAASASPSVQVQQPAQAAVVDLHSPVHRVRLQQLPAGGGVRYGAATEKRRLVVVHVHAAQLRSQGIHAYSGLNCSAVRAMDMEQAQQACTHSCWMHAAEALRGAGAGTAAARAFGQQSPPHVSCDARSQPHATPPPSSPQHFSLWLDSQPHHRAVESCAVRGGGCGQADGRGVSACWQQTQAEAEEGSLAEGLQVHGEGGHVELGARPRFAWLYHAPSR